MKDERIQTTVNRCAASGFVVCYLLISISLCYRAFILKQHPRDFWDIFAIFFISTLYFFIARANSGTITIDFSERKWWLTFGIAALSACISFVLLQLIMTRTLSAVEVGTFLIGFFPGMILLIALAYFLNQRWKRKAGVEEEE